jgi:hypothetical protein
MRNDEPLSPEEFLRLLASLSPVEFADFVFAVLSHSERFARVARTDCEDNTVPNHIRVWREKLPGLRSSIRADIYAEDGQTGDVWLFEIKRTRVADAKFVRAASATLRHYAKSASRCSLALIISGLFTDDAREAAAHLGLVAWDATDLADQVTPGVVSHYLGLASRSKPRRITPASKARVYKRDLVHTPRGRGSWADYQALVANVFEYLFCPPLGQPKYEFADRENKNRRDLIFENACDSGDWGLFRNTYDAHYVVVDAKNYSGALTKRAVLDIAYYLKSYGCGLFAILASRKGAAAAAEHAIREQWIASGKMIVPLSDEDVVEMLDVKGKGGQPEAMIRNKIAEFRMGL